MKVLLALSVVAALASALRPLPGREVVSSPAAPEALEAVDARLHALLARRLQEARQARVERAAAAPVAVR